MKYFTLLFSLFLAGAMNAQIVDPGFEAGAGAGTWGEASTNFGTPLCDAGCGAATDIYSGSWVVWFGGVPAEEVGAVTQNIMIADGDDAELSFYFKIAQAGPGLAEDGVVVELDDTPLWTATTLDSLEYADWTQVTIDVSNYADGGTHSLGVTAFQTTSDFFNIFVDEFSLSVDGVVSIGENAALNNEETVVVFPNPATDVMNFRFGTDAQGTAIVRLYNINGQLVMEDQLANINNTTYPLDVTRFEAGAYVAEITVNGVATQHRVMIQK